MWFKSSPIKLKQLHQILKWTVWKLNHYKSQPSQISDLNKQIERFININDEINEKLHNNEKLTKCAWNRNGDETNLLKILWCNTGEVETEATVDEEENEERREHRDLHFQYQIFKSIPLQKYTPDLHFQYQILNALETVLHLLLT